MVTSEGKYVYCIINDGEEIEFALKGIGYGEHKVHSIGFRDIAAVVSDSPVVEYPISRENTLIHMKVMEEIMNDYTVLPVKFGTIASGCRGRSPEERIRLQILKDRHRELKELLDWLDHKVELGLKAVWLDMEAIFREIVEKNKDIQTLKHRISSGNISSAYNQRIKLGEMVKKALDEQKAREEQGILKWLNGVYDELRQNKIFGDNMITNSAFLVDKGRTGEFDDGIERLISAYKGRIRFKYVGPVPPCNFAELVINLKGDIDGSGRERAYEI